MSFFYNLKNQFTKKIVACPVCQKKVRLPIKVGKTLEVTCPTCRSIFQITFRSTMHELFNFKKDQSLMNNFIRFLKGLGKLPGFIQVGIYLLFIFFLLYVLNCSF